MGLFNMIYACMDCKERRVGCHSSCEKYRQDRAENDAMNERVATENRMRAYQIETRLRLTERNKRKWRTNG